MYKFIKISIILIIFIILTVCIIYNNRLKVYDFLTNQEIESVKWPFINLLDHNNKNLSVIGIMGYIDNDNYRKEFEKLLLNQNIKFIGLCANNSHPRICDNPYGNCHKIENIKYKDKYIEDYVDGWCHCLKHPEKYIRNNLPLALISESDFTDYKSIIPKDLKKKYDFIAVQNKDNNECIDGWRSYYKNWKLCKKVIRVLIDELHLTGIVIGRKGCEKDINVKNKDNLILTNDINHDVLIKYMNESKFMLLPNLEEASPRVLTESLCLNIPVLVYENILGGWKYINNQTGEFFNEKNLIEKVKLILNKKYEPRKYFIENYGIINSGYKLKAFIKSIYPNLDEINNCEYIHFSKGW